MSNTSSIDIGIFRISGPIKAIRNLEQYKEVYKTLHETLGIHYSITFVDKENDLPNTERYFKPVSTTPTVFKYQESDMIMHIVRINNHFYIYVKKYPYEWIFDKLMFLCLLELDLARIHAGALQSIIHNGAIIFAGRGGVGKTTLILNMLMKKPEEFSFLGDDIIVIDKSGIVYPLPRKINLYRYHLKTLRNLRIYKIRNRNILKKIKSLVISKMIDITRRIITVHYELPYPPKDYVGAFDIRELLDVSLGSPERVRYVLYLDKHPHKFEIIPISCNKALYLIVNETLAEELWGHVNKYMGIVSTLFAFNPSVKMYHILKSALQDAKCYHMRIPISQDYKIDELISYILNIIK